MKHKPAQRGRGGIYTRPDSPYYWLSYQVGGRRVQENTKIAIVQPGKQESATRQEAETLLTAKRHAANVAPSLTDSRNVTVAELAASLLDDYRMNGRKSSAHTERRWKKHLAPFFGAMKASQVSAGLVTQYKLRRLAEGASNASVNRDIAALHRMFTLAVHDERLSTVPRMERLREPKGRAGFVEDSQYSKLADACTRHGGLWLRAAFEVAYCLGWRKSELFTLKCSQVDLMARTIRLEAGTTKNGEGRLVAMPASVYTLLSACVIGRKPR
jgi:integrase